MSDSFQQRYLKKLEATFEANMTFFRKNLPLQAKQMEGDGETDIHFDIGSNGELSVRVDGVATAEHELVTRARKAIEEFGDPERYLGVTIPMELVKRADTDIASHILDYYYERIYETYKRKFLDILSKHTDGDPADEALQPTFGRDVAPIAIVFGSGYGWHLPEIANRFELRHLFLIDTDPNIFKLSCFFVDYPRLYHQLNDAGCRVSFLISTRKEEIADTLLTVLAELWPSYYLNGIHLFHGLRHTQLIGDVKDLIAKDFYRRGFMGWGFVDDELMSLRQSLINFGRKIPLCTQLKPVPEDATVFVVGAGPSLDGLLDLLRENLDKAVIISCGTALRVLYKAGIRPDFHVEIERPYSTYEALVNGVDPEWLRDIPIVGLNVLYPRVFDLTDTPLMLLKRFDAGTGLVKYQGFHEFITSPSVTNTGLSFALDFGFKNIYLAGTDFGFVDERRHHANNTIYINKEGIDKKFSDRMDLEMDIAGYDGGFTTVPGNFRETVQANLMLTHAREMVEYVLHQPQYADAKVFNLNDGARVEKAIPLQPADVKLHSPKVGKAKVLARMMENFSSDYGFDPAVEMRRMTEELRTLTEHVASITASALERKMDVFDVLANMHRYVFSDQCQATSIFSLVKGCLTHYGRMIYDYSFYLRDEEKALAFAREAVPELVNFLNTVIARMESIDLSNPAPDKLKGET